MSNLLKNNFFPPLIIKRQTKSLIALNSISRTASLVFQYQNNFKPRALNTSLQQFNIEQRLYSTSREDRRRGSRYLDRIRLAKSKRAVGQAEAIVGDGTQISVLPNIPHDPNGIVSETDPAVATLGHGALAVVRQLEMLNVFMGFEQANKYAIYDEYGQMVGYLAEEQSIFSTLSRQLLRTHRPFHAVVLDPTGNILLKVHRPFWIINSVIEISTSNGDMIGEVHKEWHLWRRRYNLFVRKTQFARIDAGFLSWDFELRDQDSGLLAFISRSFSGFAREIFTDTGHYALAMDSLPDTQRRLTLDERAVALACAISLDFDYFSRHSNSGGFFYMFPGIGDGE